MSMPEQSAGSSNMSTGLTQSHQRRTGHAKLRVLVEPENKTHNADVVAVHGVWDDCKPSWSERTDERDHDGWLKFKLFDRYPQSRVLIFQYDAIALRESSNPSEFLDDAASQLLKYLSRRRRSDENDSKPIVLIGHDIGGTIIKKALIQASTTMEYYSIYLSVRILVFAGCPHRCRDIEHLEDSLIRLLTPPPNNGSFLRRIKALAAAVSRINDALEETDVLHRVGLICLATKDSGEAQARGRVFDRWMSTFDTPQELAVVESFASHEELGRMESDSNRHIISLLENRAVSRQAAGSNSDVVSPPSLLKMPWYLLYCSIAPPVQVPRITSDASLPQTTRAFLRERVATWGQECDSQALCISGGSPTWSVADYLLSWSRGNGDSATWPTHSFLWFKFDGSDCARNTVSGFLKFFIPQLWFHTEESDARFEKDINEACRFPASCTEDLWELFRAELLGLSPTAQHVFLVGNIDQCLDGAWLVSRLSTLMSRSEKTPRFVFTLRSNNGWELPDNWQRLELDSSVPEMASKHGNTAISSSGQKLNLLRSDLRPWAAHILDMVAFATRPLTVWELADEMGSPPEVLTADIERWFDDILVLDRHKVVAHESLGHAGLRDIITSSGTAWYTTTEVEGHRRLTDVCFRLLNVPEPFEQSLPDIGDVLLSVRIALDGGAGFRSYAVNNWAFHVKQSWKDTMWNTHPDKLHHQVQSFLNFAHAPKRFRAFVRDSWLQANPLLRLRECALDPLPVMAGLGLTAVVEKLLVDDCVRGLHARLYDPALAAAARFGHFDTVDLLLGHQIPSSSTIFDAAVHAAQGGHHEILQELVKSILPGSGTADLLRRVAFLGYDDIVQLLLPIAHETSVEDKKEVKVTALYLAAKGQSTNVVKMLLESHLDDIDRQDSTGNSPLILACLGDIAPVDIIKMLVEHHASLSLQNNSGWTALTASCQHGHHGAVEYLLSKGVQTGTPAGTIWSPLAAATFRGAKKCIRLLLDPNTGKADPNMGGGQEGTALFYAAIHGDPEICRLLLEAKANPNLELPTDQSGGRALGMAASSGSIETVRLLLEPRWQTDIDAEDFNGNTALTLALGASKTEIAKVLIEHNADVNHCNNSGVSPLHIATMLGELEIATLLVNKGARVDAYGKLLSWTPLHGAACSNATHAILKLLLESKADPNIKILGEVTPLMLAARRDAWKAVETLLSYGANLEAEMEEPILSEKRDGDEPRTEPKQEPSDTPLLIATRQGFLETVRALLEGGADINRHPSDELSAVGLAMTNKDKAMLRLLLEYQPQLNQENEKGFTPLAMIGSHTPFSMVRLLVNRGASINPSTPHSIHPLLRATYINRPDIVDYLLCHGADANASRRETGAVLQIASCFSGLSVVKALVSHGADVNSCGTESWHWTPLQAAVAGVSRRAEQAMLNNRTMSNEENDDEEDNDDRRNALQLWTESTRLEVIRYLLEHKAKIDQRVAECGTALNLACRRCSMVIVSFLLEHGADATTTDARDVVGRCPVYYACLNPDVNVLKAIAACHVKTKEQQELLQQNTQESVIREIEIDRDHMGLTVLHWAVIGANVDVVQWLLRHREGNDLQQANKNTESGSEESPFHVDVNAKDTDGWTPLMWAARGYGRGFLLRPECQHMEDDEFEVARNERKVQVKEALNTIIGLLIEHGADRAASGLCYGQKWTALDVAAYYGCDEEMLRLLRTRSRGGEDGDGPSVTAAEVSMEGKTAMEDEAYAKSKDVSKADGDGQDTTQIPPQAGNNDDDYGWRGCDACFLDVFGCYHHCDVCLDFDLCFKCYNHRDQIHPGHVFSLVGTAPSTMKAMELRQQLVQGEVPILTADTESVLDKILLDGEGEVLEAECLPEDGMDGDGDGIGTTRV